MKKALFVSIAFLLCGFSNLLADDIEIMSTAKIIPNDGTWFIPMNSSSGKIALFSEQREGFSIHNKTSDTITISSITLTRDADVLEEEYMLQNAELKPGKLDSFPLTIHPKKSLDFYVRLYPVQSKKRGAVIKVTYGDDQEYRFSVSGTGRDKALFVEDFSPSVQKLFGGKKTDEMVTGMVADDAGNVFVSGHVAEVRDKFAYDLFYGKVSPEGNLLWARLWSGPFRDYTRDPGQNDESGGSSNAIAIDEKGYLYLVGATSQSKTNNNFAALILKIDPATGDPVWENMWRPDWPETVLDKHSAEAYALDVRGGQVYVVGTTGAALDNSNALVFLLSLSAIDGSVIFQRYLDPTPKSTDRGYCVKTDDHDNIYIGGLAAKVSLLIKLKGLAENDPALAWAQTIETGWGSNINSIDTDNAGNVYVSVDRRGANTFFSFCKLNSAGDIVWGKTYDGGNNKNNNAAFIRVIGEAVYVGGKTGQSWYDAQMGDGNFVKVEPSDGKELFSAFYYTGKGPDEIGEHSLKGIAIKGKTIYLIGQVYTGTSNGYRYDGYWYQGVNKFSDYKPAVKKLVLGDESVFDIPRGAVKNAASQRELIDILGELDWQDAATKHDGYPPDGDLFYWKMEEK